MLLRQRAEDLRQSAKWGRWTAVSLYQPLERRELAQMLTGYFRPECFQSERLEC